MATESVVTVSMATVTITTSYVVTVSMNCIHDMANVTITTMLDYEALLATVASFITKDN